jgi:hypothetical protein
MAVNAAPSGEAPAGRLAGRWRPYPADDPNLGRLREELSKYNPGQETTDKIVSVLEP